MTRPLSSADRTTLEFERNDGGDEPPAPFTSEHIADKRPLDHVGIRVCAPYQAHLEWYARHLGFNGLVRTYEANEDPLKNFPPWITRSDVRQRNSRSRGVRRRVRRSD